MADYDIIVIPDLPEATSASDYDNLVIDQAGTTRKISMSNFKSGITAYSYLKGSFFNGDLTAGVFTLNHAKNTRIVKLTLFTPLGVYFPIPFTIIDANNISVDFAGDIEGGDGGEWTYLFEFWAASSDSGSSDYVIKKVINIGAWNINGTSGLKDVAHGIADVTKIVACNIFLINDDDVDARQLVNDTTYAYYRVMSTNVEIVIATGSYFRVADGWGGTAKNRGYIVIDYLP